MEVQRLVVDQSAQRQLHAAHEDIEALKRELHAARSSSRPRCGDMGYMGGGEEAGCPLIENLDLGIRVDGAPPPYSSVSR